MLLLLLVFGFISLLSSSSNINDDKHLEMVALRLLHDLHRRICDRLHFGALRMFANLERFAVAAALEPKRTAVRLELGDHQLRADEIRFDAEQKQQLVEKVEQQCVEMFALRFDLEALLDGDRIDFGHVAEHGETTLLESFAEAAAP